MTGCVVVILFCIVAEHKHTHKHTHMHTLLTTALLLWRATLQATLCAVRLLRKDPTLAEQFIPATRSLVRL